MCGIFLSCSEEGYLGPSDEVLDCLKRRGPDHDQLVHRKVQLPGNAVSASDKVFYLTFVSTVLSLRGNGVVAQPLEESSSGSLLCWNGEAWKIRGTMLDGNDVQRVFSLLLKATECEVVENNDSLIAYTVALQAVVDVIASISGPYSFIFYDARHQHIFYGRDVLGRRSLLSTSSENGSLMVSSICDGSVSDAWSEVEANGIHMLDLTIGRASTADLEHLIKHIRWSEEDNVPDNSPLLRPPFSRLNKGSFTSAPSPLQLSSPTVTELTEKLLQSLNSRVRQIPIPPGATKTSPRAAILFSGGLDCTVLARLIHEVLPKEYEVDLLNVAFENPRVVKAAAKTTPQQSSTSAYSICPDRITGLSSYAELLHICPDRTWRFVGIDIPYAETLAHRPQIISLIHPHDTEMDLSIACALYFAARGSGNVNDKTTSQTLPYTTPARALLSGLGADELFGGYTRHAIAFDRREHQGLVDELELDFSRLGKRNLGRDDRVISHWGREARYPYLDEELVRWALDRPVRDKCGFGDIATSEDKCPVLEPGKKVLRLVAWKLGMRGAASEKKRAIQFGARTAKMEGGRAKGTDTLS